MNQTFIDGHRITSNSNIHTIDHRRSILISNDYGYHTEVILIVDDEQKVLYKLTDDNNNEFKYIVKYADHDGQNVYIKITVIERKNDTVFMEQILVLSLGREINSENKSQTLAKYKEPINNLFYYYLSLISLRNYIALPINGITSLADYCQNKITSSFKHCIRSFYGR